MKLFYPKFLDTVPFTASVTNGIGDNGAPTVSVVYEGHCNYSEKAKTVRGPDGQYIQLAASLSVGEDIAGNISVLAGSVTVSNKTYKILQARRPRNPDGSVNHTELDLV